MSERIGQVKEKRVPASIISSLPSVVYTEGMFNSEDKKEDDNNKCSVCLCEYETGEELKGLPCTHYFHDVCIEKWLGMNESCPICRIVVRG